MHFSYSCIEEIWEIVTCKIFVYNGARFKLIVSETHLLDGKSMGY